LQLLGEPVSLDNCENNYFLLLPDCKLNGSMHIYISSTDVHISQNDHNQQSETFRLSSGIRFIFSGYQHCWYCCLCKYKFVTWLHISASVSKYGMAHFMAQLTVS
jgi:hypothetical protein